MPSSSRRPLKALADPARLRILSLIQAQPDGEACVCHLMEPLDLSQGTVSHHLRVLREAGLVERDQRGSWAYYRVVPESLAALRALLDLETSEQRSLTRAAVAEAIGTFALVFAGAGAIMVDAKTNALGHVGVAITFGLVIMAMIYAVGHISGAHFNGAVTFAFALTRHFPWPRAVGYWVAQLTGALASRAPLARLPRQHRARRRDAAAGSQAQSFLWEFVLTAFLMFVILAVATDTRAVGEAAAIAIGGTVGLDAMFGGPISGASMNPMRSAGPATCPANLHALWLYIVAPIIGAAAGRPRIPVRARRRHFGPGGNPNAAALTPTRSTDDGRGEHTARQDGRNGYVRFGCCCLSAPASQATNRT